MKFNGFEAYDIHDRVPDELNEDLARRIVGRDVMDIGPCGTEEVYFQTAHLAATGASW